MSTYSIDVLRGLTFTKVARDAPLPQPAKSHHGYPREGSDRITFFIEDRPMYTFHHEPDCCESVTIESIVGDLSDLENSPILLAEATTQTSCTEDGDSITYTFYKFATAKGYVDVRWIGESNGYYSEDVDLFDHTSNNTVYFSEL